MMGGDGVGFIVMGSFWFLYFIYHKFLKQLGTGIIVEWASGSGESHGESSGPSIMEQELEQLLQAGNKLEAVKLLKTCSGANLVECKSYIEALQQGFHRPTSTSSTIEDQLVKLIGGGDKLAAIKLFRQETGTGLVAAKTWIEQMEQWGLHEGNQRPFAYNNMIQKYHAGQRLEIIVDVCRSLQPASPLGVRKYFEQLQPEAVPRQESTPSIVDQLTEMIRSGQREEAIELFQAAAEISREEAIRQIDELEQLR
jgi:ribosomal protein L7/L12